MPSSSTTPAGEPADGSEINFDDAAQRIRELTERILDSAKTTPWFEDSTLCGLAREHSRSAEGSAIHKTGI